MDIRTKLIFALVAVSIGSMLALGAVAYASARDLLARSALRHLEGLAESKKDDLEKVADAWRDRVRLIASRTQLRESLQEVVASGSQTERNRIKQILDDAGDSVRAVRSITVYGANGQAAASMDGGLPAEPLDPAEIRGEEDSLQFLGVSGDGDDGLSVTFRAPMYLDGAPIGLVEVVLSARELVAVTQDHTGLGQTGETLVVRRLEGNGAKILNPLRHEAGEAGLIVPAERTEDPVIRAVSGTEGTYRDGVVDYRGALVWAATRHLPDLGLGLVVKIDEAEELAAATELRDNMLTLGLSLSAFAIVLGTLLGLYIARPIRELAQVASRIREGDRHVRARTGSEDEIGQLAETFNRMTEELLDANRRLERRIEKHEDVAD